MTGRKRRSPAAGQTRELTFAQGELVELPDGSTLGIMQEWPSTDGMPARVRVACTDGQGERTVDVAAGDHLELAGQPWRVDSITERATAALAPGSSSLVARIVRVD